MTMTREVYAQLASLAQLYLLQEHSLGERIYADAANYAYFLENTPKQPDRNVAAGTQHRIMHANDTSAPSPSSILNKSGHPSRHIESKIEAAPVFKVAPIPKIKMTTFEKTALEVPETDKECPTPGTFVLEPPPRFETADLKDIYKIISDCRPSLKLLENIPSDAEVRSCANSQATNAPLVVILSFESRHPRYQTFFENLAIALRAYGMSIKFIQAEVIEKKIEWEKLLKTRGLQLILAASHNFDQFPGLKQLFKNTPNSLSNFLGDIPLIVLHDITLYFNDPSLKQQLWQAIRGELTPI